MELHILAYNQRRLPCASLGLYTYSISTPTILLCKNRFLHVTPNMYTRAYKLMALQSQKINGTQTRNMRPVHSMQIAAAANFNTVNLQVGCSW